jgi:hypothetical protein
LRVVEDAGGVGIGDAWGRFGEGRVEGDVGMKFDAVGLGVGVSVSCAILSDNCF